MLRHVRLGGLLLIVGLGGLLGFLYGGGELALDLFVEERFDVHWLGDDGRRLLLSASLMAGWFLTVSLAGHWISAAIFRIRSARVSGESPWNASSSRQLSKFELYGNVMGLALLIVFFGWMEHYLGQRAFLVLCLPLPAYLGALFRCAASLRITSPL
jgi:hypothetical protein